MPGLSTLCRDRPTWVRRLTQLALGVSIVLPQGCNRYLWPAAHITQSHEQYWEHKLAQVDAEAVRLPAPRREQIYGPGPEVRRDLRLTGSDRSQDELLDLTLYSAIRTALQNNTVIRQDTQFLSTSNPLLGTIDTTASVFDPAIQDTNVLFGSRGVGAALADFVPTLSGNLIYNRDESIVNAFGLNAAQDTTADFDVALTKQLNTGGSLSLLHNVDYLGSQGRGLGRDRSFSGSVAAQFTYPLWAASGTEFTQIAGPADFLVPRVTSVNQGVLISRINSDVARLDLELNIRQLVRDVVNVYWDLTLAFGQYEAEEASLEATEKLYEQQQAKIDTGQASRAEIAQAAETFLASQARKQEAMRSIDENEQRLRRLLGLPVSDGRLIRPADAPELTDLPQDWNAIVLDALQRRPQLKRTKFNLRSLQLQLKAAHKLVKPRLDFVSAYQLNGFGDELGGRSASTPYESLYRTLGSTQLEGWTLGFNFNMPLNFQLERSQVSNLQLRVAKNRVQLAAQEAEVSHEIAVALQNAQNHAEIARTQQKRLDAAQTLVDALEAEYEAGRPTLDRLVRSQATLAQATIDHRRALVEFSRANSELQYRRAVLLEANGVHLQFPELLKACDYKYCERLPISSDVPIATGVPADVLNPPKVFTQGPPQGDRLANPDGRVNVGTMNLPGAGSPLALPPADPLDPLPSGDLIDLGTDPQLLPPPEFESPQGTPIELDRELPEPPPRREIDRDGDGSIFDFDNLEQQPGEERDLPEPPPRRDLPGDRFRESVEPFDEPPPLNAPLDGPPADSRPQVRFEPWPPTEPPAMLPPADESWDSDSAASDESDGDTVWRELLPPLPQSDPSS